MEPAPPYEPSPAADAPKRRGLARMIALALAWTKSAIVAFGALAFTFAGGQDPAGQAMGADFLIAGLLYWLIFILPALRLALRGRRIGLAYALLIAPDLVALALAPFL